MATNIGMGYTVCPYCSDTLHNHEPVNNKKKNPKDGDISFCATCGEVSVFRGENLEKIDEKELDGDTKELIKKIRADWEVVKDAHVTGFDS